MKTGSKGLALALLVAASCTTKNDASIELAAICSFPDDATKCAFSETCDKILLGTPWVATRWSASAPNSLDVLGSLVLPVQVNNQLKSNASESDYRVNTHDFTLEEFRLSFSSTPSLSLPARTFKLNQLVPADGSTVAFVKVIPEETMALIDAANLTTMYRSAFAPNAHVDVELKAFGHTRDGRNIETEPWVVPVEVYDVDVPGVAVRSFDPTCPGTTTTVTGICPQPGQVASISCQ